MFIRVNTKRGQHTKIVETPPKNSDTYVEVDIDAIHGAINKYSINSTKIRIECLVDMDDGYCSSVLIDGVEASKRRSDDPKRKWDTVYEWHTSLGYIRYLIFGGY